MIEEEGGGSKLPDPQFAKRGSYELRLGPEAPEWRRHRDGIFPRAPMIRTTQVMLSSGFGGAERSFIDTVHSLAEAGHEVQAICDERFGHLPLLEGVAGVEVRTLRVRGEWDRFAVWRLRAYLREFQPVVVHTQLRRAASLAGRAASREGIPVVAKLHNYVNLKAYRFVSRLIATTRDEERYAVKAGWPRERVQVIPNFTRMAAVREVRRPESERPCRLLSYGRLVEKKGFDVLLRAVAKVRASGLPVELRIGGEGTCRAALEALRKELALGEGVEVGAWIDDVPKALDAADLFVLPSLDEPFGIVILEAMARGVPIVSTRTQGPSEVLSAETSFLAEVGQVASLAEAIESAVRSPEGRQERARKALVEFRKYYSVEAVVPQFLEVYRELSSSS